jgi:hypothetical protein
MGGGAVGGGAEGLHPLPTKRTHSDGDAKVLELGFNSFQKEGAGSVALPNRRPYPNNKAGYKTRGLRQRLTPVTDATPA